MIEMEKKGQSTSIIVPNEQGTFGEFEDIASCPNVVDFDCPKTSVIYKSMDQSCVEVTNPYDDLSKYMSNNPDLGNGWIISLLILRID